MSFRHIGQVSSSTNHGTCLLGSLAQGSILPVQCPDRDEDYQVKPIPGWILCHERLVRQVRRDYEE